MKNLSLLLMLLVVLCGGCANAYSQTQVGPDRYVLVSKGRDVSAQNYGRLLQNGYASCRATGYQDYRVTQTVPGDESTAVFIQCSREPVVIETPKQQAQGSSTGTMDTLSAIYAEGKKKFEDAIQGAKPQ